MTQNSESSDVTAEELIAQLPGSEPEAKDDVVARVKRDDLLNEPEAEEASEDESPEPSDEEETESPESDEPEAESEEEESSEGDEPDENAWLLAELAEKGIGQYKTVEAALEGLKNLKTSISRRDEDAAFGRSVRERGLTPDQLEALDSTKTTPEKKDETPATSTFQPPHEFNPAWETMIRETRDEDGNVTGHSGPPTEVQKYLEYTAYEKSYWDRVRRDPSKLVSPDMIQSLVDKRIQEQTEAQREEDMQRRSKEATEKFLDEHGEYIASREQEFFGLVQAGVPPETAVEHLKNAEELAALKGKPPTGEDAIREDISKKAKRGTRRAAVKKSPIREETFDPSKATSDDFLNHALKKLLDSDAEVPAELA